MQSTIARLSRPPIRRSHSSSYMLSPQPQQPQQPQPTSSLSPATDTLIQYHQQSHSHHPKKQGSTTVSWSQVQASHVFQRSIHSSVVSASTQAESRGLVKVNSASSIYSPTSSTPVQMIPTPRSVLPAQPNNNHHPQNTNNDLENKARDVVTSSDTNSSSETRLAPPGTVRRPNTKWIPINDLSISFEGSLESYRAGRFTANRSVSVDEGLTSITHTKFPPRPNTRKRQQPQQDNNANEKYKDPKQMARECMRSGQLVPDVVVMELLKHRLAQDDTRKMGWLLDGFPRTPEQVDMLAVQQTSTTTTVNSREVYGSGSGSLPDIVLIMHVPDEELVRRVENRKLDPVTGKIYNILVDKPESEEIAARLTTREDDNAEVLKTRLKLYHCSVESIKERFRAYNVPVHVLDCGGGLDRQGIFAKLESVLLAESLQGVQPTNQQTSQEEMETRALRVCLMGPPASGKGTQGQKLVEEFGMVHVSTGDMLREIVTDKPTHGRSSALSKNIPRFEDLSPYAKHALSTMSLAAIL